MQTDEDADFPDVAKNEVTNTRAMGSESATTSANSLDAGDPSKRDLFGTNVGLSSKKPSLASLTSDNGDREGNKRPPRKNAEAGGGRPGDLSLAHAG